MVETGESSNKIDISNRGSRFCTRCQLDLGRFDDTARELHLIRHVLEELLKRTAYVPQGVR